jgi:hypothetical protein
MSGAETYHECKVLWAGVGRVSVGCTAQGLSVCVQRRLCKPTSYPGRGMLVTDKFYRTEDSSGDQFLAEFRRNSFPLLL